MNLDEQNDEIRGKGHREDGGPRQMIGQDPRVSALINWVFAALGGLGLVIGMGMYNKLSAMNDTMIIAVSKLETQGAQIADLRIEVAKQRDEIAGLRAQVSMVEGKTLRGIAEIANGR